MPSSSHRRQFGHWSSCGGGWHTSPQIGRLQPSFGPTASGTPPCCVVSRLEKSLVGCCYFSPQVDDPLIVQLEGIIANTHPSLGQGDVLLICPLPPYLTRTAVIIQLRRLADHPFALALLLFLRYAPTPTYSPCLNGRVLHVYPQLLEGESFNPSVLRLR